MPPNLPCCIALVRIDEHSWDDLVSKEGLSVREVCEGFAGVRGGVEPAAFCELLLGEFFECVRV